MLGPRVSVVGMEPDTAADPADTTASRPARRWRVGTPLVAVLAGSLFVVSAQNSEGTDLRPGRYTSLADVVAAEAAQVEELTARAARLESEVRALAGTVDDRSVDRWRDQVGALGDPAGRTPRSGPGVAITLSDAPEEVIAAAEGNLNPYVVHQQDLQAVVNALWRGGAEAITIAGQRIVTTTGIKCEGNSVVLQGVPYPQPYVVEAVGDQTALLEALSDDPAVSAYRSDAADPAVQVGWQLDLVGDVEAPAFEGLVEVDHATPLT